MRPGTFCVTVYTLLVHTYNVTSSLMMVHSSDYVGVRAPLRLSLFDSWYFVCIRGCMTYFGTICYTVLRPKNDMSWPWSMWSFEAAGFNDNTHHRQNWRLHQLRRRQMHPLSWLAELQVSLSGQVHNYRRWHERSFECHGQLPDRGRQRSFKD